MICSVEKKAELSALNLAECDDAIKFYRVKTG